VLDLVRCLDKMESNHSYLIEVYGRGENQIVLEHKKGHFYRTSLGEDNLEKTSEHYQTLQNKNAEGGN